jgi:hypothetical protein
MQDQPLIHCLGSLMGMSFLEYAAAMTGCYSAMPASEREALHAWESVHVDGSGAYGTSDWPGWEKYIGKFKPQPKIPNTSGYVYLVQSEPGHCKIGSTKSVDTRIKQLQCANPSLLSLIHYFRSRNAKQDELALQAKFVGRRIRNEWYALRADDIFEICALGNA